MSRVSRPSSYSLIQKEVGQRIRWARELVVPNRAELARMMGLDRTTLQKIEDGDRAPSIFNILDLCHRLKVTPGYILLGTMQGVDGELAARLGSRHPELADPNRKPNTATVHDIRPQPKTPKMQTASG